MLHIIVYQFMKSMYPLGCYIMQKIINLNADCHSDGGERDGLHFNEHRNELLAHNIRNMTEQLSRGEADRSQAAFISGLLVPNE